MSEISEEPVVESESLPYIGVRQNARRDRYMSEVSMALAKEYGERYKVYQLTVTVNRNRKGWGAEKAKTRLIDEVNYQLSSKAHEGSQRPCRSFLVMELHEDGYPHVHGYIWYDRESKYPIEPWVTSHILRRHIGRNEIKDDKWEPNQYESWLQYCLKDYTENLQNNEGFQPWCNYVDFTLPAETNILREYRDYKYGWISDIIEEVGR